jgi:C4-type Zn-finger protein
MDHEHEVHHECPVCESNIWNVKVIFEDYEIATYFTEMECSVCGSFAKAPTPIDKP